MSHQGKILRGKKWYNHRDREGNLPDNIKLDPNKMVDVNYMLEHSKKAIEEPPKVVKKAPEKKKEA